MKSIADKVWRKTAIAFNHEMTKAIKRRTRVRTRGMLSGGVWIETKERTIPVTFHIQDELYNSE